MAGTGAGGVRFLCTERPTSTTYHTGHGAPIGVGGTGIGNLSRERGVALTAWGAIAAVFSTAKGRTTQCQAIPLSLILFDFSSSKNRLVLTRNHPSGGNSGGNFSNHPPRPRHPLDRRLYRQIRLTHAFERATFG